MHMYKQKETNEKCFPLVKLTDQLLFESFQNVD